MFHLLPQIHVLGSDYKAKLLELVDADQLPIEYGGTVRVHVVVVSFRDGFPRALVSLSSLCVKMHSLFLFSLVPRQCALKCHQRNPRATKECCIPVHSEEELWELCVRVARCERQCTCICV